MEENIIKDINITINNIKKCHSKSRFNKLISDLIKLYDLANYMGIDNIPDIDNYSFKNYNSDENKIIKLQRQIYLKNLNFNKQFTNNNLSLLEEFPYKTYYEVKKLTLKENIEIERAFLNEFNYKLLNIYDNLLRDNRIIYLNSDCNKLVLEEEGKVIYGESFIYALIEDYNSIFTSLTTTHELGHIYDFSLNKYNKYNCCREVYSHFLELVFIDWLGNDILLYDYFDTLRENLNSFDDCLNNNYNKKIDFMTNFPKIYTDIEYSYGSLIALNFFEMYKNDKKLGLYNINKFILENINYPNIINTLDKFELSKEEIEHGLILKKYLKRL